jgi:hypothetical protein
LALPHTSTASQPVASAAIVAASPYSGLPPRITSTTSLGSASITAR